jgi:hypothetical protein
VKKNGGVNRRSIPLGDNFTPGVKTSTLGLGKGEFFIKKILSHKSVLGIVFM